MPNLQTHIKFLKNVGEKRAKLLESELGIKCFEDLLYYFPSRYIDRSKFYKISELNGQLPYVQIKGRITRFREEGKAKGKRLVAHFQDDTGSIELLWFRGGSWLKDKYKLGIEYVVFGKPTVFNRNLNLIHPEIEDFKLLNKIFYSSLQGNYPMTEKLKNSFISSKLIQRLQYNLLQSVANQIVETLPDFLIEKLNLLPLKKALVHIHFPQSVDFLQKAQFRLKFEELFYVQLDIIKRKLRTKRESEGYIFSQVGHFFNTFYKENLPFELTGAQKRVLKEIRINTAHGKHTNRLLQGDVGSGKTLVALMSMLIALDNGFQACLMAPTEVLAQQHFKSLQELLKGMDIQQALLTGSTKSKERKLLHKNLQSGDLQILVGTHALIEDAVKFKNLGLAIIDEQHRFGVMQRAKLWKKNDKPPHILVMTATPIPRTLAMTVYGDLDVSVIDEMPPGRKEIKTIHAFDSKRLRVLDFVKKQIEAGRQIYMVYPLIEESETMDYKDLTDGYESMLRVFPAPKYAISIVHGRMRPEEKEKAMQLFVKGQTQIMIATTVIEVGVNVPNASVMLIESAEKFGLSQLHQLRGRVGRGEHQSYCILMTSYKLSADARKRIETMVRTSDGFEIAETDLKLRGPGDMQGTQQSGLAFDFKIANLVKDTQILQLARDHAEGILQHDFQLQKPENKLLLQGLEKLRKNKLIDLGSIS